MAKDVNAGEAQVIHDEKNVVQDPPQEDLKLKSETDDLPATSAAAGRRGSTALNIVENPLTVSLESAPIRFARTHM